MAVAFRAESHVYGFTAANVAMTEPTGTANGDVLLAMFHTDGTYTGAPAAPTGWTTLYSGSSGLGGTSDLGFKFFVAYIARGASAPSLTCTSPACTYGEWNILGFTGCNTSSPIDSQSASGSFSNVAGGNFDPPATTAVSSAAMAVCGGIYGDGTGTSWTPPTGYTLRSTAGATDQAMASKLLSASGSENPAAFSGAATGTAADLWNGFTVTLAPAVAVPSRPPVALIRGNGVGVGCSQAVTRATRW